jgi:hypothetical protein
LEEDKPLDPTDVGLLRLRAQVADADRVADLLKQLRLLRSWNAKRGNFFGTGPRHGWKGEPIVFPWDSPLAFS